VSWQRLAAPRRPGQAWGWPAGGGRRARHDRGHAAGRGSVNRPCWRPLRGGGGRRRTWGAGAGRAAAHL